MLAIEKERERVPENGCAREESSSEYAHWHSIQERQIGTIGLVLRRLYHPAV